MKRTVVILILISFVIALAFFLSKFFDNVVDISLKPKDRSDVIVITNPVQDSEISSPLVVAGRAKGSWFFEGTFPIVLLDSFGNIVAESHVSAQGDWQTQDFVRFVGSIQFNNYVKGSNGYLVFRKSNPSGLPENGDSTRINIVFK